MSCSGLNEIISDCTYSSAPGDGVIVGPRDGNDFRFYGFIAGPGIEVVQNPTFVGVRQQPNLTTLGKFVNMGNDIIVNGVVNYFPNLNATGPGQYDQIGNVIPVTTNYTISFLVSYVGQSIEVFLYDIATNVVLFSTRNEYTSTFDRRDSVLSVRNVNLVADQQIGIRIRIKSTNGQLLLSKSYLTISTA
jgi:hypothetical protein